MKIEYFKDPIWADAAHAAIRMTVKFEELSFEVPFAATATDCEAHGRELFTRASANEVGEVAPYTEPVIEASELIATAKAKRNALLAKTDWTQLTDVVATTQLKWTPYRQALRDLPAQVGFPQVIDWPVEPI